MDAAGLSQSKAFSQSVKISSNDHLCAANELVALKVDLVVTLARSENFIIFFLPPVKYVDLKYCRLISYGFGANLWFLLNSTFKIQDVAHFVAFKWYKKCVLIVWDFKKD